MTAQNHGSAPRAGGDDEQSFRRLGESTVHQGFIWDVAVGEFVAPGGETFTRDIVRSPGAVGVVPIVENAGDIAVVLVAQYRPALERTIIEVPAGMRDIAGEEPVDVARRELIEEAGLDAQTLTLLTEIFPSPGMTDAVTTLYLATGCTPVAHDRQGPEEAHMELLRLPLAEAVEMVERGEISDAKSVVGLLLVDRRMRRTANPFND